MTVEMLGSVAGVVLSLVFSYIPGLNDWFGALSKAQKQMAMGGLLVLISVVAFVLSCASIYSSFVCTKDGAVEAVKILIGALVANQATYLLTKK